MNTFTGVYKVWWYVSSVKLHSFYHFQLIVKSLAILNCDDAILSNPLHRRWYKIPNLFVTIGRNCSHLKILKIHIISIIQYSLSWLTCAISSGVVTGFDNSLSASTTADTALWTPVLTSLGLAPLLTRVKPSLAMECANTVAVVVPSPIHNNKIVKLCCLKYEL